MATTFINLVNEKTVTNEVHEANSKLLIFFEVVVEER